MKRKEKSLFESIRKPLAPPTKIMKNKREELLMDSINQDYDENYKLEFKYAVDIPNCNKLEDDYEHEWFNVDYFETKEEAIKYCQDKFGADEEGRINLISSL